MVFHGLTVARSRGFETNFMLNSAEQEILNAHKSKRKHIKKSSFSGSDKPRMLFSCS